MRKKKKVAAAVPVRGGWKQGKKKRSLYQMTLSAIFSLLVFLFQFSRFSHGHGHRDSYMNNKESSKYCTVMHLQSCFPYMSGDGYGDCMSQECQNIGRDTSGVRGIIEITTRNETTPESDPGEGDVDPAVVNNSRTHDLGKQSTYVGLDEFRHLKLDRMEHHEHKLIGRITHRLEPDGVEFNYASAIKGAKVLAHNKEAKGADNILDRDTDKYLRNPCSADGKFVIVELSEETLVDVIEIANLEHYSSNFKQFELYGSINYPAETWTLLGTFVAENVKHAQRFMLLEPKWIRFMRLNLVSHYGSEFYCTLSYLKVYGVDVIERMLEDLMDVSDETAMEHVHSVSAQAQASNSKDEDDKALAGMIGLTKGDDPNNPDKAAAASSVPHPVKEVRQQLAGRLPSDGVLKILMQKMRSLELNLSVLEEYIKELNIRYGNDLPDLQKGLSHSATQMEIVNAEIKDLAELSVAREKNLNELADWKSIVSSKLEDMARDNDLLREDVKNIKKSLQILEAEEFAVLSVSLFFACLSSFKLVCDRILMLFKNCDYDHISRTNRAWVLMLVSSSMTILITLLYNL